jgi:antitoxin component YwqK of YwqJK toxin-antitoxin module
METYSRLVLAFLLLILVGPPVVAEGPPKDGPYVEYYDNGQKKSEWHYKDGKPDGLWTEWHENGKKLKERHYKNGKPEGPWTYWNENGQKRREFHFKNGKEVSRKEF